MELKYIITFKILLWLSVCSLLIGIGYFIRQRIKNKGKSINHEILIPTICLLLSIFFHRYIVGLCEVVTNNNDTLVKAGYNCVDEIFNSLVRTMQTFSLDETYRDTIVIGKDLFLNEINSWTYSIIFGLLASILNVSATIIGGAILLAILPRIFPSQRLLFMPWREKYVFSELNERAIYFAEDIVEKRKKQKPLIVFTDAYIDQSSEPSSELFQKAKDIGAVCLKDDILNIPFKYTRELHYILIDDEDISNIHTLTTLVNYKICKNWKSIIPAKSNKIRCHIYVFSQNPEASSIVRNLNKKNANIGIRIIQEYTSIVYRLFKNVPLYYPLLAKYPEHNTKKELILTIIGGGKIATEAFLGAYSFGQMLDCKLKINVLTKNTKEFIGKINNINHEILNSGKILNDLSEQKKFRIFQKQEQKDEILRVFPNQDKYADYYAEYFFDKIDVETSNFIDVLKKKIDKEFSLLSSDYFIIALGTDELNMITAHNIYREVQKNILDEGSEKTPVIAFSIFNPETNKIYDERNKLQLQKNNAYLYSFASLRNVYSLENIEMEDTFNLAYDNSISHSEIVYDKFSSDAYSFWSNIAQVIHYKYKVYSIVSLSKKNIPGHITDDEIENYFNKVNDKNDVFNVRLSWLEHRRWNAFMRTKGFTAPTDNQWDKYAFKQENEDKSHKNLELKLHPLIVECTEEEKISIDTIDDWDIIGINDNWEVIDSKKYKNLDKLDIASIKIYQTKNALKKKGELEGEVTKINYKKYDKPNDLAKKKAILNNEDIKEQNDV